MFIMTPGSKLEPELPTPFTFTDFKTSLRQAANNLALEIFDAIESKGTAFKPFWNDVDKVDSLTTVDIVLEVEAILGRGPSFDPAWESIAQQDYDVSISLGDLYEKVCKAGKKDPIY